MNPEEHGRESVPPPPSSDALPMSPIPGPQPRSEVADSEALASSNDLSVQQFTNQALPPTPPKFPDFADRSALVVRPVPVGSGNVIKGVSAISADARGQPATVARYQAKGESVAHKPGAVMTVPAVTPPVAPGPSPTARTDRNYETNVPVPPPDLQPATTQVEGSRRQVLPAVRLPLDLEAQRRVSERCEHRRTRTELRDFPVGAKPSWLDRLFHRTGRILVERRMESGADRCQQAWFVGDIHGDLVGLLAALDFIRNQHEYCKERDIIVLLGDLIDDLPESESVLAEVSEALASEERLVVIVGNHDDALEYSDSRGFGASVDPCDYCEYLRSIADRDPGHRSLEFAQSLIRYMLDAPVALFLSDGTMAAHGGVPHTDLAEAVAHGGWGQDPRVWSDFIWARLHPRAKSRMAVSGTRSRELGAEDFRRFASTVKSQLEFEPVRMVRGHDHVDARFEIYGGKWQDAVLTINNMSWKLPRETGVDGPRNPCIARWTHGEPIQPIVIEMDREWRAGMRPRSQA